MKQNRVAIISNATVFKETHKQKTGSTLQMQCQEHTGAPKRETCATALGKSLTAPSFLMATCTPCQKQSKLTKILSGFEKTFLLYFRQYCLSRVKPFFRTFHQQHVNLLRWHEITWNVGCDKKGGVFFLGIIFFYFGNYFFFLLLLPLLLLLSLLLFLLVLLLLVLLLLMLLLLVLLLLLLLLLMLLLLLLLLLVLLLLLLLLLLFLLLLLLLPLVLLLLLLPLLLLLLLFAHLVFSCFCVALVFLFVSTSISQ